MSVTRRNTELVEIIFKPDKKTGISRLITRDEINKTELKLCNNGNIRRNTPWSSRYIWDIERKGGKPISFRTNGFSEEDTKKRPISKEIRTELLEKFKNCINCGVAKLLCIDHKNDMYNDSRVLDSETQNINDFQVLCNKCNKDLKHQANVKEKKTGKLHRVKDLGIYPFKNDTFDYPWEKCLTIYDEKDVNCKMYTYWYDIEEFNRKRDIFISITKPLNLIIKRKIKIIN